jgi:hypothetical protein
VGSDCSSLADGCARRGIWENLFRQLAGNGRSADTQMVDSAHVKAHRSASGGKGGSRNRLLAAQWAAREADAPKEGRPLDEAMPLYYFFFLGLVSSPFGLRYSLR